LVFGLRARFLLAGRVPLNLAFLFLINLFHHRVGGRQRGFIGDNLAFKGARGIPFAREGVPKG
jgi:hypothetical protein